VERALRRQFAVKGRIEVASDMLGAARAICGHKPGIACILGTGSNSCSYDGERIVDNVSPLGFILGDEGSGAVLGKMLVADVLKRQLPETIIRRFHNKYQLTAAEIIDRVYRQKLPNRFLASFVPFLSENIEEPSVRALVKSSFRLFIRRNVLQYKDADLLPIGFVGSVAFYFRTPLQEVMKEEGLHLGNIIQAPSEGLVRYHATSNN
jgi:N-acetylglucosamine kinase-like BadF-type ATPase